MRSPTLFQRWLLYHWLTERFDDQVCGGTSIHEEDCKVPMNGEERRLSTAYAQRTLKALGLEELPGAHEDRELWMQAKHNAEQLGRRGVDVMVELVPGLRELGLDTERTLRLQQAERWFAP
jgi:hypothetical protein